MWLPYSVLMSTYVGEQPDYLRKSMSSMFGQTLPPEEFILVCDGFLTKAHYLVIDEAKEQHQNLKLLQLGKNIGLGGALNEGLKACKNDFIARMDSDDISLPGRCQRQLEVFQSHNVQIVSGTVAEFSENPGDLQKKRVVPETQEEILAFAKYRNPFNHPCVMFRKSAVEQAGGYRPFPYYEDYYLWVRMLLEGMRGCNLPETLLLMRGGKHLYERRSGMDYFKAGYAFQKYLLAAHFINRGTFLWNVFSRGLASGIPNGIRMELYGAFLRKKTT